MGWEMATLPWGKGGFWDPLLRAHGAGEVGRAVLPTFLVSPVCGGCWCMGGCGCRGEICGLLMSCRRLQG